MIQASLSLALAGGGILPGGVLGDPLCQCWPGIVSVRRSSLSVLAWCRQCPAMSSPWSHDDINTKGGSR